MCEIKNHKTLKLLSISDNKNDFKCTKFNETFIIWPFETIEIDDIFDINNFHPPKPKENEAYTIYQNNNYFIFRENKMVTVILEIKLNIGKLLKLIFSRFLIKKKFFMVLFHH